MMEEESDTGVIETRLPSPAMGTQACYLGVKDLSKTAKYVGAPAHVCRDDGCYLCILWPRLDLFDGFISTDKTVKYLHSNQKHLARSTSCKANLIIRHLAQKSANKIMVHVVFEQQKDVLKCRPSASQLVINNIKSLLKGKFVSKGTQVKCHILELGKLFQIYCVNVSQVEPESDSALIHDKTEVIINSCESHLRYEQKQRCHVRLGGMHQPKKMLLGIAKLVFGQNKELECLGMSPTRGVLVHGPTGCGKSLLVRHIAETCEAYLFSVNCTELSGSRPGEHEASLRDVFDKAKSMALEGPCIMALQEVDAICERRRQGQSGHIATQLLTLLDDLRKSHNLLVLAITTRPVILDPAVRRPGRLDKEISIGVPTVGERADILECLCMRMKMKPDVSLRWIAERTPGYVAADLASLVQTSAYNAAKHSVNSEVFIERKNIQQALHTTVPSTQRGSDVVLDTSAVKWDDIGGLEDIKMKIKQAVQWPLTHPEAFVRLGVPRPSGVLLYGPPGCAKTQLVRAAASSCSVTFLAISAAQLYSPFVGDSERKISEVFKQARTGAPSILFIDEVDALVGNRSGEKQGGVQQRVLSTLLNEMDGVGIRLDHASYKGTKEYEEQHLQVKVSQEEEDVNNSSVLVVAATNRPKHIDMALLRPGRLDRIIYVPPPDEQARLDILNVHTRNMPLHDDVDLPWLSQHTIDFTGADLQNLCREAALLALTIRGIDTLNVCQEDFLDVLETLSPSLSEDDLTSYSEFCFQ